MSCVRERERKRDRERQRERQRERENVRMKRQGGVRQGGVRLMYDSALIGDKLTNGKMMCIEMCHVRACVMEHESMCNETS